jgi:hypothetical protein
MTYQDAKAMRDALDAAYKAASDNRAAIETELSESLGIAARGAMNLIAEPIRLHPAYRAAKAAQETAFQRLREYNAAYVKAYKKEIQAERRARYA